MPLNHSSKYSELTDQQFLLLGKIMLEFSNVDFLLGQLLSRLLSTPDFLGRTYSDRLNVSNIQQAILNALRIHSERYLYRKISEPICISIKGLNTRVTALRGYRNKFAHFCWQRLDDNQIYGNKLSGNVPDEKLISKESAIVTNT